MIGYCQNCEDKKLFNILKTHTQFVGDNLPTEYSFAECLSCNLPSVFIREDFGGGFESVDYFRVYPKNERHVSFDLPELVRESYLEAVRCEEAKIWTAAVVMVGRALEAVCKEFVAEARTTIFSGLKTMKDQGLISEEIMEWANELRTLRNMGAHVTHERITSNDAVESIDFLQAILEILYYLRPKFEKMKARRAGG